MLVIRGCRVAVLSITSSFLVTSTWFGGSTYMTRREEGM